jgi:hypothetical protein
MNDKDKAREAVVNEAANNLLTNGSGQKGSRLEIRRSTDSGEIGLGGWGEMPLRDKLTEVYQKGYDAAMERECEWTRNAGGWLIICCCDEVFDDTEKSTIPPFCPECGGRVHIKEDIEAERTRVSEKVAKAAKELMEGGE